MVSESIWKKIWLIIGISFIGIAIFMIFGGPMLAATMGYDPPVSSPAGFAMVRFFWIWMGIFNGIGFFFIYLDMKKNEDLLKLEGLACLIFSILQIIYLGLGIFPLIGIEILWALIPGILAVIIFIYFYERR